MSNKLWKSVLLVKMFLFVPQYHVDEMFRVTEPPKKIHLSWHELTWMADFIRGGVTSHHVAKWTHISLFGERGTFPRVYFQCCLKTFISRFCFSVCSSRKKFLSCFPLSVCCLCLRRSAPNEQAGEVWTEEALVLWVSDPCSSVGRLCFFGLFVFPFPNKIHLFHQISWKTPTFNPASHIFYH